MNEQIEVTKEWFEYIKHLSPETQDKIIADVIRAELGIERAHRDMVVVNALVNYIRGEIHNV